MAKLFSVLAAVLVFTSMMQGKVSVDADKGAHSFSKMERPPYFPHI